MSLIKRLFVFSLVVTTVLWSFGGLTVKAEGSYGAGSLLALEGVSGSAVYYIGSDGMKYVFPDGKTYSTWYENFNDVVKVDVAELDMYPDGGAVTYRAGTKLVTHENTAKIYAVGPGGMLHWIPTAEVAENLYGANWGSMVMDVIPGYFSSSYTSSSDLSTMYPTGTLLQMGENMYYVDGTDVRPFADADAFEANNFMYDNLIEVSDVSAYGTGESITGEEMTLSGFMPAEGGEVVVPGGDLTVSLDSTTPASRTIISDTTSIGEALVDFTHLRFAASNSGSVTVDTVKLTRSGISSDSDLDTVYLYDGNTRIADGGSISSGVVTFNDPSGLFTVSAGSSKVISVKGDVASGLGAGKTIAFSLNSVNDVTLDGSGSVGGSLPATGNLMSTASVTDLGYLTVATSSAPATSNVGIDSNQEDIEVWSFNLTANDQKMWVERLVLTEVGSIQSDDLQNFRLLANGVEVGTATMANDYTLTFDLATPLEITSGSTKTMSLRADIVKGSTKTFYFSFQYMADVVAMDKTYNVYAPFYPSYNVGTWAIVKPDGNYQVNSGTVTVSRSTDSPTGTLAVNTTNVTFAKFDFKASGEDMKIKNLDVQVNVTGGTNGGVDNGKVFVDGVQVGSTKDLTEATDVNFTFGSSFVIPAGETKVVSIVGDTKSTTATAFTGNETAVVMTIGAGSSNAQGMTSLQTTSVPSTDTPGNSLSASADELTVTKYSGYGDQTFVAGTNQAKLGSFVLNTGSASGVVVNSITVTLSSGEAASISNLYLMSNGETFGSVKASPSTSNVFSDSVTIAKSGAQVFDIMADLSSNADAGSWIAGVSASGNSTPGNSSVSTAVTDNNMQTITVGTGTLSASNGSNPDSAIILASTNDNYMAEYRFSAANEAYTITKMLFTATDGFATSTAGITLEYTNSNNETEQVNGIFINSGGTYYATFTGLDMAVPKDDEATVKVYVDTTSVASGADSGAAGAITFVYGTGFEAIGTSGATKSSAGSSNLSGNTFYLRKSVPTFAKLGTQPTTPITGSALFKFSVVADAKGSIDFKQLGFTVTTSGVTVSSMKLYKSDSGTAITDTAVDAGTSGYTKLIVGGVAAGGADADVENINTTTKYYEVRGTVTGWGQSGDEITIGFKEDVAAATDSDVDTQRASYYNIWSDRSATSHTTATLDWSNGYLLKQMDVSHTFSKA